MPYGWRIVRALIVGLVLAVLTAMALWPVSAEHLTPVLGAIFFRMAVIVYPLVIIMALVEAQPIRSLLELTFQRLGAAAARKIGTAGLKVIAVVLFVPVLCVTIWVCWGWFPALKRFIFDTGELSVGQKIVEVLKVLWEYAKVWLPFVALTLPSLLVNYIERLREHPTYQRWFMQHRGGSSRWAGPRIFDKVADGNIGFPVDEPERHGKTIRGIYLGRSLFDDDFAPRDIVIEDDGHMLTIGQPGSGKSVTVIWPNLAMYDGSAIVIDPKGEHTRMFAGRRQGHLIEADGLKHGIAFYEQTRPEDQSDLERSVLERDRARLRAMGIKHHPSSKVRYHLKGSRVFVLDPFNVNGAYPSSHYNPLSEIDVTSSNARKLISAISSSCIVTSQGDNRFWEEAARAMLDGAIAHVLSRFPKEQQTLPFVADLLIGRDPETGFADPGRFKELLIEMRMNDAAGGLPQMAASMIDDLGDRAYGNVTAELRTALKWASDPAMREHLSRSDFSFVSVGQQKTTVFVALPFGNMVEQMRWLRTITEVSMRILEDRAEMYKESVGRVLYVLDELPQYGTHLKAIKEGMVTLRAAGVKLWAFVQNLKQLNVCFGEDGAKNFQSGGTVQVFGVADDGTAEWVSKKLGRHLVLDRVGLFRRKVVGQREVDLVPPAAIERELTKTSKIQYVFTSLGLPMRLERVAFKPMVIEGRAFGSLPLEGHYDEGLPAPASAMSSRPVIQEVERSAPPEAEEVLKPSLAKLPVAASQSLAPVRPAATDATQHDYDGSYARNLTKVRKLASFAARLTFIRALAEDAMRQTDQAARVGEITVCRDLLDAVDMGLTLNQEQASTLQALAVEINKQHAISRDSN